MQSYLGRLKVEKALGSDGIMPGLLRSCARELAPSVAQLINASFNCSTVPSGFKEAIITPLLKSSKLDATTPRSYRGISLLPVVSKLMERVAKDALSTFLEEEHVLSDYQFGFRCGRSAEDC